MVSEIGYLGHKISQDNINLILEKLDAIINAPCPTNVSQIR